MVKDFFQSKPGFGPQPKSNPDAQKSKEDLVVDIKYAIDKLCQAVGGTLILGDPKGMATRMKERVSKGGLNWERDFNLTIVELNEMATRVDSLNKIREAK
ncbi:hypothetical protein EPO05_04880 [Patescibacteria group bacterium]|nr:MAG: hypothetical protein EPO05_04880 [Patescibacteria group bacterium]